MITKTIKEIYIKWRNSFYFLYFFFRNKQRNQNWNKWKNVRNSNLNAIYLFHNDYYCYCTDSTFSVNNQMRRNFIRHYRVIDDFVIYFRVWYISIVLDIKIRPSRGRNLFLKNRYGSLSAAVSFLDYCRTRHFHIMTE